MDTKMTRFPRAPGRRNTLRLERTVLLRILRGRNTGTYAKVGAEPVYAGRSRDSDLVVEDPGASRLHFKVTCRNGIYVLEDLDSTNGTLVNHVKVVECRLSNGDIITVGSTDIGFFEQTKVREE